MAWLTVPWIIGCSAVAEERRLGTLEEHLCLPVSSRLQFTVKFLVTLLLGALLGAVLPCVVESLGGLFGAPSSMMKDPMEWVAMLCLALAIAGISFYASTLTSNILQALATAVAMMIAIGCVSIAIAATVDSSSQFGGLLCGGRLGDFFGWTLTITWIVTAIYLAYGNFKHLHRGVRIWLRNVLSLAAVLVILAAFTTALYHRAWEYLTPLEPPHGPARLTGAKPAAIFSGDSYSVAVNVADGRLWREYLNYETDKRGGMGNLDPSSLDGGQFVGGSNWVDAVVGLGETAGIQSDGSLWVSETPNKRGGDGSYWNALSQAPARLVRYGSETNWQGVAHLGTYSVMLLKTDGTLWGWGWGVTNRFNRTNEWPGLCTFVPRRLGTESNWAEIYRSDYRACLRKADGSVWMRDYGNNREGRETIEIEPKLVFERVTGLESGKWSGMAGASLSGGLDRRMGVRDDGTFRVWDCWQSDSQSKTSYWKATDLQIGGETNWLAVAGPVTLKRDGSLWLWNFQYDPRRGWDPKRDEHELLTKPPIKFGTHSDWVAIGGASRGIVSLAADGSLWDWQFDDPHESRSWLALSRKPQKIGNVFAK